MPRRRRRAVPRRARRRESIALTASPRRPRRVVRGVVASSRVAAVATRRRFDRGFLGFPRARKNIIQPPPLTSLPPSRRAVQHHG
eukprot:21166-Pelagococcus_subviridis.AAC.1